MSDFDLMNDVFFILFFKYGSIAAVLQFTLPTV